MEPPGAGKMRQERGAAVTSEPNPDRSNRDLPNGSKHARIGREGGEKGDTGYGDQKYC